MKELYADYARVIGSRRRAAGLVLLTALSGVLEVAALTSLIPLLNADEFLAGSGALSRTVRNAGLQTPRELAYAALAGFAFLGLASALAKNRADTGILRMRISLERDMRSRMSSALLSMDWTAFHGMRLGDITKSVIAEGHNTSLGVQAVLQATGNLLVGVFFVVSAFVLAPALTLLTFVFGGLVGLAYRAANRRMDESSRQLSAATSTIGDETESVFGSLKYIRTTGGKNQAAARTAGLYQQFAGKSLKAHELVPAVRLLFEASGLLFVAAVLAVSVVQDGEPSAASLAFVALFYRLAPRLHSVQEQFMLARSYRSWLVSWRERLDVAESHTDRPNGTVAPTHDREVRLDGVVLEYPNALAAAVDGVNMTLARGTCTAIVGESGSGKSTILDLVSGLLAPTAGRLTADGVALELVDRDSWQSRIGVVMQDNPIYHATVEENIAWLDPAPDRARVREAAAAANAATFIEELDAGYDTVVGERGGRLSGGQRQRLALARALYRQPWLLLLDEATSALDSDSEALVLAALAELKGRHTMVLVAHRLATTQIADTVIVLQRGRVVQTGTFADLLRDETGPFAAMAAAQGLVPAL